MCGIAGILTSDTQVDLPRALRRMIDALAHRGPDSQALEIREAGDFRVGLAHTRLAILDLSDAGRQPMPSSTGRHWITYNGEVYNFQKLRDEISTPAKGLRSHTDTEIMLEAFESGGVEAIGRFRGMFAFGIWDEASRTLYLARDPLGIKPLYFWQTPRTFIFASEVRALLASGLVPRQLSPLGIASYLRYGSVEAPGTTIEGVYSMMPGSYAAVRCCGGLVTVEQDCYPGGRLHIGGSANHHERRWAASELGHLLREAVQLHLVSDVPLGVFLSGGVDSSALVALASQAGSRPPKTFSVVFQEREFSEESHARLVASRFRTEHQEVLLTEGGLLDLLPLAFEAMDQPTPDGVNTFVISKAVKEAGVTVALSGLGGDELFAGYPSFRRAQRIAPLRRVPRFLRRTSSAVGRAVLKGSVRYSKLWELLGSDASPHAAYRVSRRLFSAGEVEQLMSLDWPPSRDDYVHANGDPINVVSRLELQGYMANTLLRDTDSMSMAHALEVRVPFLDSKVVNFVLQLPGNWKVHRGVPKPLLLEALGNVLPEQVWKRPKVGFNLPFERWMRAALKDKLDEAFSSPERFRRLGFEPSAAEAVWKSFIQSPDSRGWSRPWALFVVQCWCELNGVEI